MQKHPYSSILTLIRRQQHSQIAHLNYLLQLQLPIRYIYHNQFKKQLKENFSIRRWPLASFWGSSRKGSEALMHQIMNPHASGQHKCIQCEYIYASNIIWIESCAQMCNIWPSWGPCLTRQEPPFFLKKDKIVFFERYMAKAAKRAELLIYSVMLCPLSDGCVIIV